MTESDARKCQDGKLVMTESDARKCQDGKLVMTESDARKCRSLPTFTMSDCKIDRTLKRKLKTDQIFVHTVSQ